MKIWDVTRGKQVEGDPKVSSTHRFKQLVFKFVRSIANVLWYVTQNHQSHKWEGFNC